MVPFEGEKRNDVEERQGGGVSKEEMTAPSKSIHMFHRTTFIPPYCRSQYLSVSTPYHTTSSHRKPKARILESKKVGGMGIALKCILTNLPYLAPSSKKRKKKKKRRIQGTGWEKESRTVGTPV